MAQRYTTDKLLDRQRALVDNLRTQGKTGVWGNLADVVRGYGAYKGNLGINEAEEANAQLRSDDRQLMAELLRNPEGMSAPDFSSMAVTEGMDPTVLEGAQANSVELPSFGEAQFATPQGQEFQMNYLAQQNAARAANEQKMRELEFGRETDYGGIDRRNQGQIDLQNLRGNQAIDQIGARGAQQRLTNFSDPYTLSYGQQRYGPGGMIAENQNARPSSSANNRSFGSMASLWEKEVLPKGTAAASKLGQIRRLKIANNERPIAEGMLAPAAQGVLSLMESMPGFDSKMLSNMEQFDAWVSGLKAEDMSAMGARGLTDQDMKILARNYPMIGRSKEANAAILDVLERSQFKQLEDFAGAQQRFSQAGGLGNFAAMPPSIQAVLDGDAYRNWRTGQLSIFNDFSRMSDDELFQ